METSRLTLDELAEDVVYHILEQVLALRSDVNYYTARSIKHLSCASRRMRARCMPVLFHTCQRGSSLIPPEAIRPFVRNFRYTLYFYTNQELHECGYLHSDPDTWHDYDKYMNAQPPFGLELDYFPAIRSVVFDDVPGGVPWYALAKCLQYPGITSISFGEASVWMCAPPPTPSVFSSCAGRLTTLSYAPSQWRQTKMQSRLNGLSNLQQMYALESIYLHALVLPMSNTAESLTLPAETAPLTEMAAKDWPRLQSLSLVGRYTHPDQCRAIPLLLARMPNLHMLSVQVMQREGMPRPFLLQAVPGDSYRLRVLKVSYPNPDDPLFSYLGDGLTTLSLRDSPRHYFQRRYQPSYLHAISPILTSSACLTLLRRVLALRLSVLELVYQADAAEDELLSYLPQAFPLLQELELHRYRASLDDDVPYLHIARILTSVKYLRALYLNVDIRDYFCEAWDVEAALLECRKGLDRRGPELVEVLQGGECFEYVALLLHQRLVCEWRMYYPEWSLGPKIDARSPHRLDTYAFVTSYGNW